MQNRQLDELGRPPPRSTTRTSSTDRSERQVRLLPTVPATKENAPNLTHEKKCSTSALLIYSKVLCLTIKLRIGTLGLCIRAMQTKSVSEKMRSHAYKKDHTLTATFGQPFDLLAIINTPSQREKATGVDLRRPSSIHGSHSGQSSQLSLDANDRNAQFLQRLTSGGETFLYDGAHVSFCEK